VTTSAGSIAARLNRLAPTRAHREATVVAGIGTFFDIFDIFLTGVLSTVLVEEFHLGRSVLPPILASSFVGMFVGAWTLGWIADRVGRRAAFLVNLAIYSGFTLAGAFSSSATMLIFTRFMAGIGIGAELVLVDTYLGELLPPSHRGRYTAWAYTLGFLGVPAAGFLARVLVPTAPFGVAGWRWMFVAGSLGAVIVWGLRARLPESPRWLASVGRLDEADAIVTRFEREAHSLPPVPAALEAPAGLETAGLRLVFGPAYRGRMAMLCVLQIFPTAVRATASGAAYGMSRLSTAAIPFLLVPVLDRWGAGPMFACIALALWIVIANVALFAPATTGRSLEGI